MRRRSRRLRSSGVMSWGSPPAVASTLRPSQKSHSVRPSGYSRAKFGQPWYDVDDNGCDTRDDVLANDLTGIATGEGGCVVKTGTLHDPYTGTTTHFVRGKATSSAVQIDHVVALGDAWRTGAARWTKARRLVYANDPAVLLAVDGPANEAKGDGDAADWLPPKASFGCRYVAIQIAIKTKARNKITAA